MATTQFPDGIDTSQDCTYWTNTITVQYLSKTQEAPPPSGMTVTNVMWFEIRKGYLPAESILLKYERTFRLGRIMMQGVVPKPKDIIVDDQGIRWVIGAEPGAVEILSYGNEYRVHTNKSMKQNSAPAT